ncbi:nudC domain-containing protein 1 [Drosophila albomicans]|uniref:NudC domain-containing protein 1 n=1 Tax=Drosophila albomicans TaxID=7291 RepID=A0A6P8XYA4_DROAB|nr:nudC domain-containing protein 1 [Drosophila albomicans]
MSVVDLQVNRNLLCPNFDGYKLSFDPVPVLRQSLDGFALKRDPHANQYSLLHTELFAKHNLLFSDPWARHQCYYINVSHELVLCSYNEADGQPRPQRTVYQIPRWDHGDGQNVVGDYNYTLRFVSEKLAVLCDGVLTYMLLDTGDRERAATWQLLTRSPVTPNGDQRGFVLHDARLDVLQERKQISLAAAHIERRREEFVTQLTWSRWSWQQAGAEAEAGTAASWTYELCQPSLATKGSVYYCAFEPRAQSLIVCSNGDLQTPQQHEAAREAAAAQAAEDAVPPYDWQQTPQDLSLRFTLPADAKRDDLKIESTSTRLLVEYKDQLLLDGALFAPVDEQLTNWTLEAAGNELQLQLQLQLSKTEEKQWPNLLAEQELPAEPLPIPNLEDPIEDCDLPLEASDNDIKMVRFNLGHGCITHTIFLGAMPPLFGTTLRPGFPAAFATRHDVDGAIWLQQFQPSRPDEWNVRHEGQLNAFGYVVASKEQRKFVDCCPQLDYAVICESYRHVFIYKPHNEAAGGLRNRNGPQIVIGKQHLVTLPDDVGEVLGLVTAPKVIIIFTQHAMLYLQV